MIHEALQYYNFKKPEIEFVRHNENMTYEIRDGKERYLLRIHNAAEGLNFSFLCGDTPRQVFVKGEIELLLQIASDTDIEVQHPIKNRHDQYISELRSGDYVTVLSWIDGNDMMDLPMTQEIVFEIGKLIGRLHNSMSDMLQINRYCYDEYTLDLVLQEIEKARRMKHIGERHQQRLCLFLDKFMKLLQRERHRFILIHADLNKSNLIYKNSEEIIPIDFSLSGYALPETDLADMCWSLNDEMLAPSLINGYKSISKFCPDDQYIDVCTASSLVLYIAYHHGRFYKDEKFQRSLDGWIENIIDPMYNRM